MTPEQQEIQSLKKQLWRAKRDTGEIDQLKGALPDKIYEDCDSYIEWDILKLK